jgi:hypothetical protein
MNDFLRRKALAKKPVRFEAVGCPSEHQAELEQMGWMVRLLNGYRHELFARPDVVVPLVRNFVDAVVRA